MATVAERKARQRCGNSTRPNSLPNFLRAHVCAVEIAMRVKDQCGGWIGAIRIRVIHAKAVQHGFRPRGRGRRPED
jgi:hypothetical protein